MAQTVDKKTLIRQDILAASIVYRDALAGKVFLYISGDFAFELFFPSSSFMHLTGIASTLSAVDFYKKAKASQLSNGQFYFDKDHPYRNAKKKLPCLLKLPELTKSLVCVVRDMQTVTLTYKIGITDLNFTLGLTENVDSTGTKINDWFKPRTLRVKDKAMEESANAEFVDFIFCKDASVEKYTQVMFADPDKSISAAFEEYLSPELVDRFFTNTSCACV